MPGEMLSFSGNGEKCGGYIARSVDGRGHGVVVIQEWWGLVPHIETVADRFAAEGFTALAPDLYCGEKTDEPELAGKLMMALNIGQAEQILGGAVDALLSDRATKGEKVGVVGFCMGGQLALYAASINPKIGACVDFYGIHPNVHPPFEQLHAPVLGLFAEFDEYTPPAAVNALDARLTNMGKDHEFHIYPGVQHAFFNDTRHGVYDGQAAEDAWQRSLAFFRHYLK